MPAPWIHPPPQPPAWAADKSGLVLRLSSRPHRSPGKGGCLPGSWVQTWVGRRKCRDPVSQPQTAPSEEHVKPRGRGLVGRKASSAWGSVPEHVPPLRHTQGCRDSTCVAPRQGSSPSQGWGGRRERAIQRGRHTGTHTHTHTQGLWPKPRVGPGLGIFYFYFFLNFQAGFRRTSNRATSDPREGGRFPAMNFCHGKQ